MHFLIIEVEQCLSGTGALFLKVEVEWSCK